MENSKIIKKQTTDVFNEFLEAAKLSAGKVLVVGCSSSEVIGCKIGSSSSEEVAAEIAQTAYAILQEKGIRLAAQCCEHLNRALIVEKETAESLNLEQVNVVPFPKAGGSFATAVYHLFREPVAVEAIKADAGIDIGDTLIGMHLKNVAVPVRTQTRKIGEANIVCARTRCKFVGGERAHYNSDLL